MACADQRAYRFDVQPRSRTSSAYSWGLSSPYTTSTTRRGVTLGVCRENARGGPAARQLELARNVKDPLRGATGGRSHWLGGVQCVNLTVAGGV